MRGRPSPTRRLERRLWFLAPFFASAALSTFWLLVDRAIAGLAGLLAVAWLCRRPGAALRWLAALLPVSMLGLSLLYRLGLPYELVRPLGFWKEALAGAVLTAGVLAWRRDRTPLDALDKVGLAYVGLATLFLALPLAGVALGNRVDGFRTDALYVALLLGARHARIPTGEIARAARWFVGVCVALAALAVYEFAFPSGWNTLVTETLGLTRYKLEVLGILPGTDPTLFDVRIHTEVAGRSVLRLGGAVIDYQQFAFLLLVAVALVNEQQVRRAGRSIGGAAVPLLGAAVLFTQTRSAVVALGAMAFLALRRQRGRDEAARVRYALVTAALVVVAVPAVFAIGLSDRLLGEDDVSSNDAHRESSASAVEALLDEPLGRGLATAAGAGQRAVTDGRVVSENQFLQIGTQLGLLGLGLWVATYALALRRLGAAVATGPPGPARVVAAGTRTALLAFVPAMFLLQVLIWFPVAWTLWGFAGAALGALERPGSAGGDRPQDAGVLAGAPVPAEGR